jgi:protein MpaA
MSARPSRWVALALAGLGGLTACSGGEVATPLPTPSSASTTTTVARTTTTTAPRTTTTVAPTTTTSLPRAALERVLLGRSVEGRPIEATRYGTPGGKVVLVIGVIHGDEDDGVPVLDRLAAAPVPEGIDLWLLPSINPDGQAAGRRTNAHQVDLNRNFPNRWAPLGRPGEWQYAGTVPASEPETQAAVAFIERIRPELTIWYHQDLNRIAPSTGEAGRIRRRYAELTDLPLLPVTGGTYTGTASPWAQRASGGVSFIVELGPTVTEAQADQHAAAVLAVATELDG